MRTRVPPPGTSRPGRSSRHALPPGCAQLQDQALRRRWRGCATPGGRLNGSSMAWRRSGGNPRSLIVDGQDDGGIFLASKPQAGHLTVFDGVVDDVGERCAVSASRSPSTMDAARDPPSAEIFDAALPGHAGRRPPCAPTPRNPPFPARAAPAPTRLDSSASSSRRIMSSISAMARCCSAASGIFSTRSRRRVANVLNVVTAIPPIRTMRDSQHLAEPYLQAVECGDDRANLRCAAARLGAAAAGRADRSTRSTAAASCASGRVSRCMTSKRQQRHDGAEQSGAEADRQAERRHRQAGGGHRRPASPR